MPRGTKVEKEYQKRLRQGKSKKQAAIGAQYATGQSLKTGRKLPRKSPVRQRRNRK